MHPHLHPHTTHKHRHGLNANRGARESNLSPCRAALRRAALTLEILGAIYGRGPFLGAGLVGLVVLVQPRILMEIAGLHGTAPNCPPPQSPKSELRVRVAGQGH